MSKNQQIEFFQKWRLVLKENYMVILGCSLLILFGVATLIVSAVPQYVRNNPDGYLSYLAFMFKFQNFEPTYLERFPGAEMPFGLKSVISRRELDIRKAGFKECSENGVMPMQQSIRPHPRIFTSVKCAIASHLGVDGSVEMLFVNDRLSWLEFFPNSGYQVYKIKFEAEYNVKLDGKEKPWISEDLIFRENELNGKKYVIWLDIRLRKQELSWMHKYT